MSKNPEIFYYNFFFATSVFDVVIKEITLLSSYIKSQIKWNGSVYTA